MKRPEYTNPGKLWSPFQHDTRTGTYCIQTVISFFLTLLLLKQGWTVWGWAFVVVANVFQFWKQVFALDYFCAVLN